MQMLVERSMSGPLEHDFGYSGAASDERDGGPCPTVVSILVSFTALSPRLLLSEVKGAFDTFEARLRSFAGDLRKLRHPSLGNMARTLIQSEGP